MIKQKEPIHEKVNLSFAQMEGSCYCCKSAGHKSQKKDKPKVEWAINKCQQSHAHPGKSEKSSKPMPPKILSMTKENMTTQNQKKGWTRVHHQLY